MKKNNLVERYLDHLYLESLHEGKIWDKTKEYAKKTGEFVKKHKGKIASGVGVAAAAYGGKKAVDAYNKPERVKARELRRAERDKKIQNIKNKWKNIKNTSAAIKLNTGAAIHAGKETAKTVTKPIRWVAKKIF